MKDINYIDLIDNIEEIEQIITPPKYRRCCLNMLELCKVLINYFKKYQKI